jgi:uncharacterized membrane protein YqiK
MKFWLTFLQTLPSFSDQSLESLQFKPNQTKETVEINPNQPTLAQLSLGNGSLDWLVGVSVVIAVVLIVLFAIWSACAKFYVVTPNNEAFVKNGGFSKQKKVIVNGGCLVIPGFDELTKVPLREISIDVERTGNLAVRTQDYLRANMRVTFYVCINSDQKDILTAAARLSRKGQISETDIKEAIEKRADDAIRSAAKKKSISEIDSDKLGFADEVLNLIQQDLKKVGLTLNNIAISEIEESDTYDENNFFDAQGVRLRTETIQQSIKQKMDVELKTEQEKKELQLRTRVGIEQRELQAEKQSLMIAQEKEDAKLTQNKEIESLKAQREREIQESKDQEAAKMERNKILQQQAIEEEKINQQLAVQQSQIAADIALEERNKELKVARIVQQQEAEVAEISRQKTIEASRLKAQVEVAEAEQESKIAQQQTAIAIAEKEKERFGAEAEKAQAEEAVSTAKEVEIAEREQRLSAISAEQEAQKKRISDQNVVEIDVYRRKRQAEVARQAAELEADSIRTLAEAARYKALAEAQGKRALIEAENSLSNANRTADLIKVIWPDLAPQLPEIIHSLAPQPGVLGDARIYSFPGMNGANGNGASSAGDINKLLLSTSGLSLINTLLDEGKLATVISQVKQLLSSDGKIDKTSEETSLEAKVESHEDVLPKVTPTRPRNIAQKQPNESGVA